MTIYISIVIINEYFKRFSNVISSLSHKIKIYEESVNSVRNVVKLVISVIKFNVNVIKAEQNCIVCLDIHLFIT